MVAKNNVVDFYIMDEGLCGGGGGGRSRSRRVRKGNRAIAAVPSKPLEQESLLQNAVRAKHREYTKKARFHRCLYLFTRILAALCAGLLPFTLQSLPTIATVLSVLIVLTIVLDSVIKFKDNWHLYSRATDMLALAQFKSQSDYKKYEEHLNIILATEETPLKRLEDLEELLSKIMKGVKKVKC